MTMMSPSTIQIKVFDYLEDLDAFLPTPEYAALARELRLAEWNPVVWLGRLFLLDNDFGEHWFDNWDEREAVDRDTVRAHGLDPDTVYELLIVLPGRFVLQERDATDQGANRGNDRAAVRKAFWTDVLRSLRLSLELLFTEARRTNERKRELEAVYTERVAQGRANAWPSDVIADLEERIARITVRYQHHA